MYSAVIWKHDVIVWIQPISNRQVSHSLRTQSTRSHTYTTTQNTRAGGGSHTSQKQDEEADCLFPGYLGNVTWSYLMSALGSHLRWLQSGCSSRWRGPSVMGHTERERRAPQHKQRYKYLLHKRTQRWALSWWWKTTQGNIHNNIWPYCLSQWSSVSIMLSFMLSLFECVCLSQIRARC